MLKHKTIAVIAAATILGLPGLALASGDDSQKREASSEQEAKASTESRQFAAVYIPPAKAAPRRTVGGATRGGH